jgi:PAS domain S-box-containing protein
VARFYGVAEAREEITVPGDPPRHFDLQLTPLRDARGRPLGRLLVLRDITTRKQAEESLQRAEAELREAQRIAHVGSWYWDARTDENTVSEELERIFGQPCPPFGRQKGTLYPPEVWERLNAAVQRTAQTGIGYQLDLEALRGDGTRVWITTRGEAVRDGSGRVVGLRGTVHDITERKQAEETREQLHAEAAQQARLLDTIVTTTDSRLAYLDRDLRYVRVNAAYAASARMAPEDFVGRHRLEVFPDAPEVVAMYRQVLDTGEPGSIAEYTAVPRYRPEAGPRTVRIDAAPVWNGRGEVEGVVASLVEITDQVQQRQQLLASERARAELAETLNRETSHRTKNNLAMIAGLLQMQMAEARDPDVVAALRDTTGRIMAFASLHEQFQSGGGDEVDLLGIVRGLAHATTGVFAFRNVQVTVEGASVVCPRRVATNLAVMANELVTNAIKHGGPGADGEFRVEARVAQVDGRLELSVWNSGEAVPVDFDPARQRGLGLRLVWSLVTEQYGGAFTLHPQGGGSLAEVTVPVDALRGAIA